MSMAYLGVEWFNGQIGDDFGRFWMHFAVDRTVLLFALALVCGAAHDAPDVARGPREG